MNSPTGRSIREYFAPKISTSTRENAQSGSHERPPKKIKITADNGQDIALRPLPQKVKRERTEDSLGTTRRISGRLAKLGLLLGSIPLDVLLEIFSYLAPLDILRLSRTNKDLRRLLLDRSSTYVWKAALSGVPDLPACPDDLSLPFWTNLLFDHHCQNCLANNIMRCNFALRARFCNKCANEKLVALSTFNRDNKIHQIIIKCIPFSEWNDRDDLYCAAADRDRLFDELELVLKNENPDATADFISQRHAEVEAHQAHAQECKAWMDDVFLERGMELNNSRRLRAEAIRAELIKLGYRAELEFLDNLDAGICAIYPWPRIIEFRRHWHVKPPKLLTEKVWASIKEEMVQYMDEASRLRQKNIRCVVIRSRRTLVHRAYVNWRMLPENLQKYPADALMPNPADVLEFPSMERLITEDTEIKLDMDLHILPRVTQSLPPDIDRWRKIVTCALMFKIHDNRLWNEAKWLHDSFGQPWDERLRRLNRAVVVFRCKHNNMHWRWEEKRLRDDVVFPTDTPNLQKAIQVAAEKEVHAAVMWYPQFVHHKCTSMKTLSSYDEHRAQMNLNLRIEKEYEHCQHAEWDPETLVFDEQASRTTRNILEACGMDWQTTTTAELDERDPRLACLKCSFGARCDGERKVRVWAWRDAVQHCLSAHFGDARVAWECLSPDNTRKARQLDISECIRRGFHAPEKRKIWCCLKCRDTTADAGRMNWDGLVLHFRRNPTHGDADNIADKEGTLYHRALDVCPREGPPVKMVPTKFDPPAQTNQ